MHSHKISWFRYALLALLLCLVLPWTVLAQVASCDGLSLTAFDFETLTVSTAAIGLTTAKASLADAVYVTIEGTAGMRYRIDGLAAPTATVGHLFEPPGTGSAGSISGLRVCGRTTLLNLRMIRASTSDVTMRVSYLKLP